MGQFTKIVLKHSLLCNYSITRRQSKFYFSLIDIFKVNYGTGNPPPRSLKSANDYDILDFKEKFWITGKIEDGD